MTYIRNCLFALSERKDTWKHYVQLILVTLELVRDRSLSHTSLHTHGILEADTIKRECPHQPPPTPNKKVFIANNSLVFGVNNGTVGKVKVYFLFYYTYIARNRVFGS